MVRAAVGVSRQTGGWTVKNTHSMAVITTKIIPLVLQRGGGGWGGYIIYIGSFSVKEKCCGQMNNDTVLAFLGQWFTDSHWSWKEPIDLMKYCLWNRLRPPQPPWRVQMSCCMYWPLLCATKWLFNRSLKYGHYYLSLSLSMCTLWAIVFIG